MYRYATWQSNINDEGIRSSEVEPAFSAENFSIEVIGVNLLPSGAGLALGKFENLPTASLPNNFQEVSRAEAENFIAEGFVELPPNAAKGVEGFTLAQAIQALD